MSRTLNVALFNLALPLRYVSKLGFVLEDLGQERGMRLNNGGLCLLRATWTEARPRSSLCGATGCSKSTVLCVSDRFARGR